MVAQTVRIMIGRFTCSNPGFEGPFGTISLEKKKTFQNQFLFANDISIAEQCKNSTFCELIRFVSVTVCVY